MHLHDTEEDRAFRLRVRAWLAANQPTEPRPLDGPESVSYDLAWQRRQHEAGWAGIAWPREHGGLGLSLTRQLIWHEEYARADAPQIGNLFVAVNHAGPTLVLRGTEEQKAFHLPRILRGEAVWCQGFSEPGAGSDLAGIRTRGVVDGDHLVVTGQKIWTSFAQHARYQELLVRTDPAAPRHKGLTWVICDMQLPGITVRPILSMAGEYHCNEVFYDAVRIPLANVVGRINDGWSVAMCTLGLERGQSFIARQIALEFRMRKLVALARVTPGPLGGSMLDDGALAERLARLQAEVAALKATTYVAVSTAEHGAAPGPEGAMIALQYSELAQRVMRTAMDVLGPAGLVLESHDDWNWEFLNSFKYTITGGTAEIRRNIIAEQVLGLPKSS